MVTDPQTHKQTHRQDRLQYTASLSLARSVMKWNPTFPHQNVTSPTQKTTTEQINFRPYFNVKPSFPDHASTQGNHVCSMCGAQGSVWLAEQTSCAIRRVTRCLFNSIKLLHQRPWRRYALYRVPFLTQFYIQPKV